ncbi:MAG: peptidyl-prolyl cis-trans isomerase [Acidobacteriia bacterium]|nr:peptidyl-prolyl cis-trans isomerase [Terriglobia bacterium]
MPTMIRNLLFICILIVAPLWAQEHQAAPSQSTQPPAVVPGGTRPQPIVPAEPVAADAPVVTVHGICPAGQTVRTEKSDSCTLVLTRTQFEALVSSINITNQPYAPQALRGFATGYATILALAEAGEHEGVDKDPRFQELMAIARTRALADSYRRFLQEKYGNPPAEEIEAYYKQNLSKFEQMRIERIQIPKVNPKRPQERRPEFEKKARQLAEELRERAAKGEDMTSLQIEAYNSLSLNSQPPQTEMSINPKPTFQALVEQDINALKPGGVTKVEFEPSGFNIYKLRSRNVIPLEQAKAQIVREISQKNIDAALKAATSGVHSDLNEQYFNPRSTGAPQAPRIPARMLPPGAVHPN